MILYVIQVNHVDFLNIKDIHTINIITITIK